MAIQPAPRSEAALQELETTGTVQLDGLAAGRAQGHGKLLL